MAVEDLVKFRLEDFSGSNLQKNIIPVGVPIILKFSVLAGSDSSKVFREKIIEMSPKGSVGYIVGKVEGDRERTNSHDSTYNVPIQYYGKSDF